MLFLHVFGQRVGQSYSYSCIAGGSRHVACTVKRKSREVLVNLLCAVCCVLCVCKV